MGHILQKMQSLALTWMHCHSSGKEVATIIQNPRKPYMLKTLRWALIQDETLLVTLLLPDLPTSAFTSWLSHPSILHLTTV